MASSRPISFPAVLEAHQTESLDLSLLSPDFATGSPLTVSRTKVGVGGICAAAALYALDWHIVDANFFREPTAFRTCGPAVRDQYVGAFFDSMIAAVSAASSSPESSSGTELIDMLSEARQ